MQPAGDWAHYCFPVSKIGCVSSMQLSSMLIASFLILLTQEISGLHWDSLFTYLRKP